MVVQYEVNKWRKKLNEFHKKRAFQLKRFDYSLPKNNKVEFDDRLNFIGGFITFDTLKEKYKPKLKTSCV